MKLRRTALLITLRDEEGGSAPMHPEIHLSLGERLVLLHLGSTAGLFVLLGVVTAVRHGIQAWGSRRGRAADPAPAPQAGHQVARVLEPRVVDLRSAREPGVAGGIRGSS